jgi:ribonuclease-3
LIHSSYANENPKRVDGHNERLEFLGDAVLGVIVSDFLYQSLPDQDEGGLTARRAALVNRDSLAELARDIALDQAILLGRGESEGGGAGRPSLLAGAFEAVIGALYLSDGLEETARVMTPILRERAEAIAASAEAPKSAKSRLQEWTQRGHHGKLVYELRAVIGPAHEQAFTVAVIVGGRELGTGEGTSRQRAEERAASAALAAVEVDR